MNPDHAISAPEIPGLPSDDEIRAELVRTGGPAFWRPNGTPDGTATNFANLPKELADKLLAARLMQGPGSNGTPYQKALWEHHDEVLRLEKEQAKLASRIAEVASFDPETGAPIMRESADTVRALKIRMEEIDGLIERKKGPAGMDALDRKLRQAVQAEKARLRRAYVMQEAEKLARQQELDEEIKQTAAAFRKRPQ